MAFRIEELIVNVICGEECEEPSAIVVIQCRPPKSRRRKACPPKSKLDILGAVGERNELTETQLMEIKAELKLALAELGEEL